MCMIHYGDSPESVYTKRYEIGYILYLIAFTLLFFIKIGVMIFGYRLYFVLYRLLNLPKSDIDEEDAEGPNI